MSSDLAHEAGIWKLIFFTTRWDHSKKNYSIIIFPSLKHSARHLISGKSQKTAMSRF